MLLLVNLIRVPWSRTRTQYAVLKFLSSLVFLTVPMSSADFHEAVVYALSCVGRQNMTLTVKPKQEKALVVVVHLWIVARAVFAWFPTGYGKSSCYQLLAFVHDFKLKWTRSRGTERNVCAIAGVHQVVYVFLLRTNPFTFTGD